MARKSPDQTARRKRDPSQNSLMRLLLRGAAVGLLAGTICHLLLILYVHPDRAQTRMAVAAAQAAGAQAQLVNQLVERWQFRLRSIASDPLLATPPATAAAQSQAEQALRLAFPEVASVQLITLGPLGIAGLHPDEVQLRNNIEMDMLRRASGGTVIPPESYPSDEGQLITFAQPVVTGEQNYASAVILLSVPAGQLGQWLATVSQSQGEVTLLQQIGSQPQTIVAVGQGDRRDQIQIANLNVPNWQLQFVPASSWLHHFDTQPLLLWLSLAGTLVGILLGCLLQAHDLRAALRRNLAALTGTGTFDLPGFAETRQQLGLRPPAAATSAPVQTPAPAVAPAPVRTPAPAPELLVEELPGDPAPVPDTIFRAYDIRGIAAEQLTDEVAYQIGLAIGSEAVARGQQQIVVGRDGRDSSERIARALIRGLQETGRDVIDVGMVPTPVLYFATFHLGTQSGVMVTGSHNPAEYNGMKIMLGGRTLSGRAIKALQDRIATRDFAAGRGSYRTEQVDDAYIDYITNDVAIAQPLKIVVDAGNGVTGLIAPRLFEALGCEVIPLFCDVDPRFPNHHPDPTVDANLRDLQRVVVSEGADLGLAFDGDGDRIGVVTGSGRIIAADRLLMLLAQDVVARNPGADVVFDVKCSRLLNNVISSFGGRPIMWKSGHSYMKEKMAETGALVGGEFSGHIFFNERWFGFDDGMYAGARLIEILSTSDPSLDNQLSSFPTTIATPELKIPASEQHKFELVAALAAHGQFGDGKVTTLDGVRVDYPDGWGLIRASNTTPALTARFEADDEAALERIQQLFREQLTAIDTSLEIGF